MKNRSCKNREEVACEEERSIAHKGHYFEKEKKMLKARMKAKQREIVVLHYCDLYLIKLF